MGLLLIVSGFPLGVFLSWRQPTSTSRGWLGVSGGIGVFFWLVQLSGGEVAPQSAWMITGCFLWGFAIGNVARYAIWKELSVGKGEETYAETEDPEKRLRSKPAFFLQTITLVPTYWIVCFTWWWLYSQ